MKTSEKHNIDNQKWWWSDTYCVQPSVYLEDPLYSVNPLFCFSISLHTHQYATTENDELAWDVSSLLEQISGKQNIKFLFYSLNNCQARCNVGYFQYLQIANIICVMSFVISSLNVFGFIFHNLKYICKVSGNTEDTWKNGMHVISIVTYPCGTLHSSIGLLWCQCSFTEHIVWAYFTMHYLWSSSLPMSLTDWT